MPPDSQPPSIRPRVSRKFLLAHRRRSFARAAAEITHEFGLPGITTSTVVQVAGTARKTFYESFSNVNECMRFGILEAFERLIEPVRGAEGEGWRERLEAAVSGYYDAIASEPLLAELYLVHSYGVKLRPDDPRPYDSVLGFVPLLASARAESGRANSLPLILEEVLGGTIVGTAERQLRNGKAEQLPALASEVATFTAAFYAPGHREAGLAASGPRAAPPGSLSPG